MSVDPEQLEKEADELFRQANLPVEPEQEPQDPETEIEQADGKPQESEEVSKLKESYRHAHARVTQATQEAADLRRQVQVLTEQMSQLQHQATPPQPDKVRPEIETLEKFASDYEDLGAPVLSAFKAQQERIAQLEQNLGHVNNDVIQTNERMKARDEFSASASHEAAITAAHPDAFDLAGDPSFQGWVQSQAPIIRQAVAQGTAQDVIWVLNQYKSGIKPSSSKLEEARRVASPSTPRARQTPTTGQPRFTRAQIAAMSAEEFAKREPEIDDAISKGLIY